jgi:hypothetical protein
MTLAVILGRLFVAGLGNFSTEFFVWAVGALAELRHVPFDAQLLLQRFPPPYDIPLIRQALEDLGLREIHPAHFKPETLPCLVFLYTSSPAPPRRDECH